MKLLDQFQNSLPNIKQSLNPNQSKLSGSLFKNSCFHDCALISPWFPSLFYLVQVLKDVVVSVSLNPPFNFVNYFVLSLRILNKKTQYFSPFLFCSNCCRLGGGGMAFTCIFFIIIIYILISSLYIILICPKIYNLVSPFYLVSHTPLLFFFFFILDINSQFQEKIQLGVYTSSDLPKFQPLWLLKNRGLSFLSKTHFSTHF